jgi:hypothetical protein
MARLEAMPAHAGQKCEYVSCHKSRGGRVASAAELPIHHPAWTIASGMGTAAAAAAASRVASRRAQAAP